MSMSSFFEDNAQASWGYAHVSGSTVVNILVWDGVSPYPVDDGDVLVPLPYVYDDEGLVFYTAGIGWTYRDGEFIDERPPAEDEDED